MQAGPLIYRVKIARFSKIFRALWAVSLTLSIKRYPIAKVLSFQNLATRRMTCSLMTKKVKLPFKDPKLALIGLNKGLQVSPRWQRATSLLSSVVRRDHLHSLLLNLPLPRRQIVFSSWVIS